MNGPYRTPDGDIDLDAALGPHLGHYVAVMVSGQDGTASQVLALGGSQTPHGLLLRRGFGLPALASSRGTVAVSPEWSWDVCGYYAALGVRWTASRGEIRRAYILACTREHGQHQDERLTYVVAQLSDAAVRRAYDLTPLGQPFLGDKYLQERLKRAATAEAVRRRAQGEESSTEEVLEEAGIRMEPPPRGDASGEAREAPGPSAPRRGDLWARWWGYYVISGPLGAPAPDAALLEAWQGLVAAALREHGVVMEFAVGAARKGAPMVLRDINKGCIFLLTGNWASPELAREAVKMGVTQGIVENSTGGHLHATSLKGP